MNRMKKKTCEIHWQFLVLLAGPTMTGSMHPVEAKINQETSENPRPHWSYAQVYQSIIIVDESVHRKHESLENDPA